MSFLTHVGGGGSKNFLCFAVVSIYSEILFLSFHEVFRG